jgi:shikimate kinase
VSDAGERRSHVVLVGLMGSGKSTVAATLGQRLSWPVIDLDEVITRDAGSSVAEIFAAEGEAGFRRREHDALVATLAAPGPTVVASGGGVVGDPANRAALHDRATTVWLRVGLSTALRRVGAGHGRPLLQDDPRGVLERLIIERTPLYADVADLIIDVDRLRPSAVATAIIENLELA